MFQILHTLKISHKHCSVILLKALNQAEGLVRRFRGSQEIPGVTLQNLSIIHMFLDLFVSFSTGFLDIFGNLVDFLCINFLTSFMLFRLIMPLSM